LERLAPPRRSYFPQGKNPYLTTVICLTVHLFKVP
jgi:hypothetical protein